MQVDDSAAEAAEAELDAILASLPPHAVDHIADILDVFAEKAGELFIVEGDGLTALGTAEDLVFLKPTALFEELMTTLRVRAAELEACV
ncbi:hypothetical protein [Methyloligella halotolerans]|uniref:hypothetical protein n=1 Tax=Methyloligella halotolerans TaxID=1177755 RepID=UPI00083CB3D1|nr:hypothetical protein [Methyloligella halotolerans]